MTTAGSTAKTQDSLLRRLAFIEENAGLGAALEGLRRQQVETGFIRDDLSEVRRYEFFRGDGSGDYFLAQFNPARARRQRGSGLSEPPAGQRRVHDGCFLCAENIEWQQEGREIGYPLSQCHRPYTAWMNPFPLAVGHTVIATDEHIHQHWETSGIGLDVLAADVVALANALPGWMIYYNGLGAGATIAGHLHLQGLPRRPGLGLMPIEHVAERNAQGQSAERLRDGVAILDRYPLAFMHWRGPQHDLLPSAAEWLRSWQRSHGGDADASANLLAVRDADHAQLDIYFIPRAQSRSRAHGLSGAVGALEVMGEMVYCLPEEHRRLEGRGVDYVKVASMLREVSCGL